MSALLGGALIGLAATLLWLSHGRIAGISGITSGVLRGERGFRVPFLLGLLAAGVVAWLAWPAAFATTWTPSLPVALLAGALVGAGTKLGNGCTSGHGVCGVSRLSLRSIVATCTFVACGMVTVALVRRLLG